LPAGQSGDAEFRRGPLPDQHSVQNVKRNL
jgi:hypothetical protein